MVRSIAVVFVLSVLATGAGGTVSPAEQSTIIAYEGIAESVVLVLCRSQDPGSIADYEEYGSSGSGFALAGGLVITNYHVIENALEIEIYRRDGRRVRASVVGTAPSYDLALLRTSSEVPDLPPARIGSAGDLQIGQKILAVGSPYGLESSVTSGIVSGLNRELPGTEIGPRLIQFDASINPGQSGGPLVDSNGFVVGVITAKIENGEAVGFAIPVEIAIDLVPDLVRMGHPFQPQIGLQGTDMSPGLASLFDLDVEVGFLVESVEEGGPADLAGLASGERVVFLRDRLFVLGGDIIRAVDGEPISGGQDLARHLRSVRPNSEIELEVHRGGKTRRVRLAIPPMKH